MTYSIVARDPQTGLLGVAVQTAMFAAGASVPWARAGVGAVAAQAIAEPAYGPRRRGAPFPPPARSPAHWRRGVSAATIWL